MLPQFVEVGRILTMRHRASDEVSNGDGAALAFWNMPIVPAARAPKSTDPVRLVPTIRRKMRKWRKAYNVSPGRQIVRRPGVIDVPERPEDWRTKAIRAAWEQRDWWTLKAFGEIDEVPEP